MTTSANESDLKVVDELLHVKEAVVHADAGYTGADKRVDRRNLARRIAAKRSRIKAIPEGCEKRKLKVIERPFGMMNVLFCGLAKSSSQLTTLFAPSILWMAGGRSLAVTG